MPKIRKTILPRVKKALKERGVLGTVWACLRGPWTLIAEYKRAKKIFNRPVVQDEFDLSKVQLGYLTSAFLGCYMIAAPFVGPLADRYSRKLIIVLGALFWSVSVTFCSAN